jgi:hypothetical protein
MLIFETVQPERMCKCQKIAIDFYGGRFLPSTYFSVKIITVESLLFVGGSMFMDFVVHIYSRIHPHEHVSISFLIFINNILIALFLSYSRNYVPTMLSLSIREVMSLSPARAGCVKPKTIKIGSNCSFAKSTATQTNKRPHKQVKVWLLTYINPHELKRFHSISSSHDNFQVLSTKNHCYLVKTSYYVLLRYLSLYFASNTSMQP